MRILYGVQGTGNGHLTRAHCMAKALSSRNIEVDYLFSGRPVNDYGDMRQFVSRRFYQGLTFVTRHHGLDRWRTIRCSKPLRFIQDLRGIDPNGYDLVLTDYEPLTAWSATIKSVPLLGLGHQYAFNSGAPLHRGDIVSSLLLRYFAPARQCFGVHWYRYGKTVLPPIINTELVRNPSTRRYTLVYLPFAEPEDAVKVLKAIPKERFEFYSPKITQCSRHRNVTVNPFSRERFHQHLVGATQIVTSAGFELISEALHIGTPILAIPLAGQIEQLANAIALQELKLARTAKTLEVETLRRFLADPGDPPAQKYPDVAAAITDHCRLGASGDPELVSSRLWGQMCPG